MENAFAYGESNPLEDEGSYPYEARNDNCRYNRGIAHVKTTGYWHVQPHNVDALKGAVQTYGPVSVAIEAD